MKKHTTKKIFKRTRDSFGKRLRSGNEEEEEERRINRRTKTGVTT